MKRTTIKDIANMVGVNPSTVSRALKDHPDISVSIREKIKEVANTLNYKPNQLAINLRQQNSKVIGLIIPEITMFFFPSVIKGIASVAQQEGYQLLVLQSNESLEQEIENVQICFKNGVDGLLVSVSNNTKSLDHLLAAQEIGIPVVLFDKTLDNEDFDEVLIDDAQAAYNCTEYLIKLGCSKIAGLFGNPNLSISQMRFTGYKRALKDYDIPFNDQLTGFVSSTQDAYEVAFDIYKSHQPDGYFLMSDEIIAGVLPAVKAAGARVPDDVNILGISDGYLPEYLDPKVTHLKHDGFEVGETAARRLINRIKNDDHFHGTRTILRTKLVQGHSTKKEKD